MPVAKKPPTKEALGSLYLGPTEEMLSNHLSDGIGMTRVPWSQLPNAEEPEGLSTVDDDLMVAARNLAGLIAPVESLDYEVIENYAYREQQVLGHSFTQFTIEFDWL